MPKTSLTGGGTNNTSGSTVPQQQVYQTDQDVQVDGQMTVKGPITAESSYAGGDDDGAAGHFDSTSRLSLSSFQRANAKSFGEVIRAFLRRADAKAMNAWYGPQALYDVTTRDPKPSAFRPWAWAGAHYEANNHASLHGHYEIEVPDASGALQGRFEVPFIDQSKGNGYGASNGQLDGAVIGVDYTNIRTNLADFSIRAQQMATGDYAGRPTCFRIGGGADRTKDIKLSISSDMQASGDRWIIRATAEAEAGSNAGTNLTIVRCADDGTVLGEALRIRRSDGQVLVGGVPVAPVLFARKTSDQAITSNITPAADADLTVAVAANSVYTFEAYLIYDGDAAGDLQFGFLIPTSALINWTPGGVPSSQTVSFTGSVKQNNVTGTSTDTVGSIGAGTKGMAKVTGILRTLGNAGNLQLKWAQGTSSVVATTLFTDSYLKLSKVA